MNPLDFRKKHIKWSKQSKPLITDVTYQYILKLCSSNPMTAHVDDIIKATNDLVVPLLGAISAITSEEVSYGRDMEGIRDWM